MILVEVIVNCVSIGTSDFAFCEIHRSSCVQFVSASLIAHLEFLHHTAYRTAGLSDRTNLLVLCTRKQNICNKLTQHDICG